VEGAISSCEMLVSKVKEQAYRRVMPVFKRISG